MMEPETCGEVFREEFVEVLYSVAYLAPWDPDHVNWEKDLKHDVVKQYLLDHGDPRTENWDGRVYQMAVSEITENST